MDSQDEKDFIWESRNRASQCYAGQEACQVAQRRKGQTYLVKSFDPQMLNYNLVT